MRVNDNDGGNDGDGNQADEGGTDDMMDRRMMVMMMATAMRVMMAITTMNGGAGASDVFLACIGACPAFPSPRHSRCAPVLTRSTQAKRTHAGPKNLLPRQAHTLSPTRQRQRPFTDSHCQEALHSLHARLVQAPSCAEICAQGVHLISGQLELEAASRKCQAKQWRVCRKGSRSQTVTKIQPDPHRAPH